MNHEPLKTPVGKKNHELWNAYKEVLTELQAVLEGKPVSTTEAAQTKKVQAAVKKAQSVDLSSVEKLVEAVQEAKTTFEELQTAIDAKKDELKSVHELEAEANSALAILTAKDQLVAEREAEADEILNKAKEKANEILTQAELNKLESDQSLKEAEEAYDKRCKREQEEYDYDFERMKKQKLDRLNDEVQTIKKGLLEDEKKLDERQQELEERESKVEELQDEIESLKAEQESKIAEAVEDAKNKAKQSANFAASLDKKDAQAAASIAQAEIASLKEKVSSLESQLNLANKRVQESQAEMAEMARASFAAHGDAATISKVAEVAAGGGKK